MSHLIDSGDDGGGWDDAMPDDRYEDYELYCDECGWPVDNCQCPAPSVLDLDDTIANSRGDFASPSDGGSRG